MKTYDVHFNDANDSNSKGFNESFEKLFKFYSKIILWQRYASWLRAYRPCIHSQWSVS